MKKTNKTLILMAAIVLWPGMNSPSMAQQKPISILESLKKIQQPIEARDDLEKVLNAARSMQERATLGVDEKTAEVVNSLQNPFIPQLPKKVVTQPPVVQPQDTPPVQRPVVEPIVQPVVQPPPPPPPPSRPDFTISGLVWNSPKPQAIVNGDVVTVGDVIGDNWLVTAISRGGVEVKKETQTFTIEQRKPGQPINQNPSQTRAFSTQMPNMQPSQPMPTRLRSSTASQGRQR